VQPKGYITLRESGRERDVRHFLSRSLITREFDKPSRERKQMTAGFGLSWCALLCSEDRHIQTGKVVLRSARWQQACIVKLRQFHRHSGSYQRAFEWLELDDAKVSCPVPRGLGGSNAPWPPDRN
jgi:hypothetical protein